MDIQKEREAFEDKFPVPAHWIDFDGLTCKYICKYNAIDDQALKYQARWEAWLAAKAQVVPKWISVEDKLPELKEHTWRTALPVNVMIDGYGQYLCYPCQDGNGVFYWADATCYGNDKGEHPIKCDRDTEVLNVTHWMPLPDAPQEPAND